MNASEFLTIFFISFSLIIDLTLRESAITMLNHPATDKEDFLKTINPNYRPHLAEPFNDFLAFADSWVQTRRKDIANTEGAEWFLERPLDSVPHHYDRGLTFLEPMSWGAISAMFDRPLEPDSYWIVQYEVTFQKYNFCKEGYVKLMPANFTPANFSRFSPYSLVFGPDKCEKAPMIHFTFTLQDQKGFVTCKSPDNIDHLFIDGDRHLYTLVVTPGDQYYILVDQEMLVNGSFYFDCLPAIIPDDPIPPRSYNDFIWDFILGFWELIWEPISLLIWRDYPQITEEFTPKQNWREFPATLPRRIPHPRAFKPEDWAEDIPPLIRHPTAKKPIYWIESVMGEWEPPIVTNPECLQISGCGPWAPEVINNPAFNLRRPEITTAVAIGVYIFSSNGSTLIDNILVTDNYEFYKNWTKATYVSKKEEEIPAHVNITEMINLLNDFLVNTVDPKVLEPIHAKIDYYVSIVHQCLSKTKTRFDKLRDDEKILAIIMGFIFLAIFLAVLYLVDSTLEENRLKKRRKRIEEEARRNRIKEEWLRKYAEEYPESDVDSDFDNMSYRDYYGEDASISTHSSDTDSSDF